jgi:hypothetical protein
VTRRSPSMVNLEGIAMSYLRIVVPRRGLEPPRP